MNQLLKQPVGGQHNEENPNEDAEDKHIKEEELSEEAKSIIEKE